MKIDVIADNYNTSVLLRLTSESQAERYQIKELNSQLLSANVKHKFIDVCTMDIIVNTI